MHTGCTDAQSYRDENIAITDDRANFAATEDERDVSDVWQFDCTHQRAVPRRISP